MTKYILICGLMLLMTGCTTASASWPESEWRKPAPRAKSHKPRTRYNNRRRHYTKTRRRKAEVKSWLTGCLKPINSVGDQAQSTKGARAQADKAWSQLVRAMHGERWMDLRNAKGITYSCWRSSVPNVVNRATAAIGIDSQFERCRIIATACVPKEVQ